MPPPIRILGRGALRPMGCRGRDNMSSLSGEGERWSARPLIFKPPRWPPLAAGPRGRPLITELVLVTMLGSMPWRVHDDGFCLAMDGQSPTRWRLLVQCEHERETSTGPDGVSWRGIFHKESHWSSKCSGDPHKSQGASAADPFSCDEHCDSS